MDEWERVADPAGCGNDLRRNQPEEDDGQDDQEGNERRRSRLGATDSPPRSSKSVGSSAVREPKRLAAALAATIG